MSLDVYIVDPTATYETEPLYWANITHNLTEMADKAGLYEALWRPYRLKEDYKKTDDYESECSFEESVDIYAKDIIEPIEKGLKKLKAKPRYFEKYNSPNGWGSYEYFVPFVEKYLDALKRYPEGKIKISR